MKAKVFVVVVVVVVVVVIALSRSSLQNRPQRCVIVCFGDPHPTF